MLIMLFWVWDDCDCGTEVCLEGESEGDDGTRGEGWEGLGKFDRKRRG